MTAAMRAPAFAVGVVAVLYAVAAPVHAQDYPNHSVNVVVPFPGFSLFVHSLAHKLVSG